MSPKKTSLYSEHVSLGAHMVEFADTLLPVRYQSEKLEHLAVRNAAGMFDVSHMGELLITGDDGASFLNRILTNNVLKLSIGEGQYSLLLNHQGGIIDDLIVYRLADEEYLLCVNAANIDKDWLHIASQAKVISKLGLENASEHFSQIAIQGPNTESLFRAAFDFQLPKRFSIKPWPMFGEDALVARTGYTGEDGVEIFVANEYAPKLWQALLREGQRFQLMPCGLAARDSLRLEAGLLLCGQDMDESRTPLEAGLMFAVDLTKPEFLGKAALVAQKESKRYEKLMGYWLLDRGIARHGFLVFNDAGEKIGVVTSGTMPPTGDASIGFAYIDGQHANIGDVVNIDIRGRQVRARLSSPRFLSELRPKYGP